LLEQLADHCHNLVRFEDDIGNIELIVSFRRHLGERLAFDRAGTLCDAIQGIGCAGLFIGGLYIPLNRSEKSGRLICVAYYKEFNCTFVHWPKVL